MTTVLVVVVASIVRVMIFAWRRDTKANTVALVRAVRKRGTEVGIGTSIFLMGVGANLKYAVSRDVSGVNLDTVGVILMVVGVVGLLLSLLWTTIWADRTRRDRTVVAEPTTRRRVVDRDVY